jgi:hypothetical protein
VTWPRQARNLFFVPLNQNTLAGKLIEFGKQPNEAFIAGRKMAQAYAAYAGSATSCAGASPLPAAIEAAAAKLGGQLGQTFAASKDPVLTATQMAAAFAAFWLDPPIQFPSAAPGLVTTAIPATLQAALIATWAQGPSEGAAAARKLAKVLHKWTKTVIVAHGPTPACVSALV